MPDLGDLLPTTLPLAFPIVISTTICRVSLGPFSLLGEAFETSTAALQASQLAFAELWKAMADRRRMDWERVRDRATDLFRALDLLE